MHLNILFRSSLPFCRTYRLSIIAQCVPQEERQRQTDGLETKVICDSNVKTAAQSGGTVSAVPAMNAYRFWNFLIAEYRTFTFQARLIGYSDVMCWHCHPGLKQESLVFFAHHAVNSPRRSPG
jgi:hypothetical protein